MEKQTKLLLLRVGLPLACVLLVIILFVPIFGGTAGGGRVGGAAAIYGLFAGERSGWDSEGYYSSLTTLSGVELKPGKTLSGGELSALFAALSAEKQAKEAAAQAKNKSESALEDAEGGGSGGSGGGSGGSGGGSGGSGGYTQADVVSYTITGVSKSGDSATVTGTARMRDGATVSGAVYLRKVNGSWKVVGYSM
ncbi:MAG: hypothetical protein C4521_03660 [Actinobacteria bacterium]|nr:MAG: hypothetical protein C4521_03660 [Actinomycetota bacterium]